MDDASAAVQQQCSRHLFALLEPWMSIPVPPAEEWTKAKICEMELDCLSAHFHHPHKQPSLDDIETAVRSALVALVGHVNSSDVLGVAFYLQIGSAWKAIQKHLEHRNVKIPPPWLYSLWHEQQQQQQQKQQQQEQQTSPRKPQPEIPPRYTWFHIRNIQTPLREAPPSIGSDTFPKTIGDVYAVLSTHYPVDRMVVYITNEMQQQRQLVERTDDLLQVEPSLDETRHVYCFQIDVTLI